MAKYIVDCIMSLYTTRAVEANSPEEAERKAYHLLHNDDVWYDLVCDWDDPSKTDWLREKVEIKAYREFEPEWDTEEKFIG